MEIKQKIISSGNSKFIAIPRRAEALSKKIKDTSQKDLTEMYCKVLDIILDKDLTRCVEQAGADVESELGFNAVKDNKWRKTFHEYLLVNQSKVVKSTIAAYKHMIKCLEKDFQDELRYRKEDKYLLHKYPHWMMDDVKIVAALKRFQFTLPILNYLWNYNRFTRGDELKEMKSLTEERTGGKIYLTEKDKKYTYAIFVTNAEFRKNMSEQIGCSVNYIQQYLMALKKIGVIVKLGKVGREGTIYADGYYIPCPGDKLRKEVFLKNTKAFRSALRSFNPLVSQNVQDIHLKSSAEGDDKIIKVTRPDVIKAIKMLCEDTIVEPEIKTANVDFGELKDNFIHACESIPDEEWQYAPRFVKDIYEKLYDMLN